MFYTPLGADQLKLLVEPLFKGTKKTLEVSTALMLPLMKALREILKSYQMILFLGAPLTVGYLLYDNTATYRTLSFRIRRENKRTGCKSFSFILDSKQWARLTISHMEFRFWKSQSGKDEEYHPDSLPMPHAHT